MRTPLEKLISVMTVGFAAAFIGQAAISLLEKPVRFMAAQDWCIGDGYVEARFIGIKLLDMEPVPGSVFGSYTVDGRVEDTIFQFVADPTPDSSKSIGWRDFGRWRWNAYGVDSVTMIMRHRAPGAPDGTPDVPSRFGPYDIPGDAPNCPFTPPTKD